MHKKLIDWTEALELAASLCEMEVEDVDDSQSEIEQKLYDKFEISLDKFEDLVELLLQRANIAISPLTNSAYLGISNKDNNMWLVKKDITPHFIGTVIQWATEGEELKKGGGFEKTITNAGKAEYIVSIRKPK